MPENEPLIWLPTATPVPRRDRPREPTSDECSAHAPLGDGWYAIWYPQMGGYVGKAAVRPGVSVTRVGENIEPAGCFDMYVWHNGAFPFDEDSGGSPAALHHCDAEQFINFGEIVLALERGESEKGSSE